MFYLMQMKRYSPFGWRNFGYSCTDQPTIGYRQIAAILRETDAKVVVTLKAFPKTDVCQKTAQAVALAPNVHTVLEVDLLRYLTPPKSWIVPLIRPKNDTQHSAKVINFNELLEQQNTSLDFEDIQEDRVAALFHTGGTTACLKLHSINIQGWLTMDGLVRN